MAQEVDQSSMPSTGGLSQTSFELQASNLKSLNLAFCSMLLDAGVQALAKFNSLSDLNLAYCKWITDDGIGALSSLTALTCLNLQGCSQTAPHLDKGLTALHAMSGLVSLNMGSCKLKAGALLHLSQATQLTELSLRFCKGVRPQDLPAINTLHRLKQLDMTGCAACNDVSVSSVADLRYLQKLNLSFNRHLTDEALVKLTVLSNLQHLSVNSCPCMTEAGLDCVLALMPSVTKVSTTESCEAEQFLLLQNKRVASCAASLQTPDGEQEAVVEE